MDVPVRTSIRITISEAKRRKGKPDNNPGKVIRHWGAAPLSSWQSRIHAIDSTSGVQ